MILSKIQLDLTNREVIHALADRDLLHKHVLSMFPDYPGGAKNARELMGILFRVEAPIILMQSKLQPVVTRMPEGYRILGSKDVTSSHLSIRDGGEYRFRLEANVSYRNGDGRRHAIVEEKGRERWIFRRGERAGFEVVDYSEEELPIIRARRGRFCSVRFDGILKVKSTERFLEALHSGVGQGKVYGLGLLSISR